MFTTGITIEDLNRMGSKCMVNHLGIEVTEIGADYLKGKMPVDHRTTQPFGILHGGASVSLAETLGSIASSISVDQTKQYCVGLDINANHIRSVREGFVFGIAKPLHVGKKTHVWEIKITNEADQLVCISRLTMAVIDIKK